MTTRIAAAVVAFAAVLGLFAAPAEAMAAAFGGAATETVETGVLLAGGGGTDDD